MNITAIIVIIVSLSFLVFVHELGHFIAAKLSNIYVKQFSIGLPPKLFGKKIGETEYAIGALPIGGYVKLYGEDEIDEEDNDIPLERAFSSKSPLIKLTVLSGGVFMNFLVGILLIMVVFAFAGQPVERYAISIDSVVEDSPAAQAGIESGSFIIGYKDATQENFQEPNDFEAFVGFINSHLDKTVELQLASDLNTMDGLDLETVTASPAVVYEEGRGSLGVEIGWYLYTDFKPVPWLSIPGEAVKESVDLVKLMVVGVKDLITELVRGSVPEGVAGALGVAVVFQDIFEQGFIPSLHFVALISINLMIVNLLPFPALDGGRIIFVLAEMILGRSLDGKVQQWIHLIGFAVLILLMVAITYNDIITFL